MFTGIIESVATVRAIRSSPAGMQLEVELGSLTEGLAHGASVAVNGACLTVASVRGEVATFDAVVETVQRTNLGKLRARDRVNVERSLRIGSSLDGHFVQGHVDGVARVGRIETTAGQWKLWCEPPAELMRYMVPKGSVAIDGISLTLVDVTDKEISVAVIPTTLELTTLGSRKIGDSVNVETDLIARIVVRQMDVQGAKGQGIESDATGGVTMTKLIEGGFV